MKFTSFEQMPGSDDAKIEPTKAIQPEAEEAKKLPSEMSREELVDAALLETVQDPASAEEIEKRVNQSLAATAALRAESSASVTGKKLDRRPSPMQRTATPEEEQARKAEEAERVRALQSAKTAELIQKAKNDKETYAEEQKRKWEEVDREKAEQGAKTARYVLEGTLAIRAGEHVHQISAGGAVIVPGGTAHTFWNPRPDPARYVLVMGARTFALIQAIHETDDRSPARMRQLYAAHGATLLG